MGQKAQRDRTSGDFKPDSFQYAVLSLRESCARGEASPQQTADWQALCHWLGSSDALVTAEQADRLKDARIAFLHRANGSKFEASKLPPPDICDIFERLSPAGPAIEKMKLRHEAKEKPKPAGIGREMGSFVGSLIAFGLILAPHLLRGVSDPEVFGEFMGAAMVPAAVAFMVAYFWKGGPDFRPLSDGFIVAAVAGGLQALSMMGRAPAGSSNPVAPLVALIMVSVPAWLLTAVVTGVLNWLAARLKRRGATA